MAQNEKDLLLKDLCARLHTCNCINGTALIVALADEQPLESNQWLISNYDCYKDKFIVSNIVYASDVERPVDIDNIKPYLFPLSSMTEEQLYELREMFGFEIEFRDELIELSTFHHNRLGYLEMDAMFEWFNRNHFDYRGLIPMGLANDATGKNIY